MVNSPDRRPIHIRHYPWWGLVLVGVASFFNWSLGYFWIGRWVTGLAWLLAALVCTNLLTLVGAAGLLAGPHGHALYLAAGAGVVMLGLIPAVDAARRLNRSGPRPRRRVRLAVCAATLGLFFVVDQAVEHRTGMRVESFHMTSTAMQPTLSPGERLVANTLAFGRDTPEPGDLVLARFAGKGESAVVRRVISGPGHSVAFFEGQPLIDGVPVRQDVVGTRRLEDGKEVTLLRETLPGGQSYMVAESTDWRRASNLPPVLVGDDRWFLLGDHRDEASDSRHLGTVARGDLAGRLVVALGADGVRDLAVRRDHAAPAD